ncbi:NADPH-dependent FMN reductase [Bowmanella yangjiangensis]|uniref:NAD(P)H-dependent oxidoreductase n=1 Tax=Bowmanella yangjiangensis TaxID=2811230 RepID=A0ABS3CP44_9ALTE|nr:NAD(P)H-dependent oxidoreductase [Bowmanella yangjiangensis]MBN7818887.1 NAD(P)H-dependent oxidoreductase [Bowmanella yangjiangensis]
MARILAFSGSSRKDSYNQKLVGIAAKAAEQAGAQVTLINLGDFPMPIYNQDLQNEQGFPTSALAFKQLLLEHDGLLIASPEYNSAFSPLLKNAIDWASRASEPNEAPLSAYRGKTAAIMSCAPGALGGLRGLGFLRMLLQNIGVMVVPNQRAIGLAGSAFDEHGQLKDAEQHKAITRLAEELVQITDKLVSP